jgi:hypothetical protein
MRRVRVSTTVDGDLLGAARRLGSNAKNAALLDEALSALVARIRASEIDAAYVAYDEIPIEEPDEWGSLAEFRAGIAAS